MVGVIDGVTDKVGVIDGVTDMVVMLVFWTSVIPYHAQLSQI